VWILQGVQGQRGRRAGFSGSEYEHGMLGSEACMQVGCVRGVWARVGGVGQVACVRGQLGKAEVLSAVGPVGYGGCHL